MVFATTELYELISIPQSAPDGLLATVVALRTKDPTNRIVTFDGLVLEGDLHQTWDGWMGGSPTPNEQTVKPSVVFANAWSAYDSHLLIDYPMIRGRYGAGFMGITEENDGSDPVAAVDALWQGTDIPLPPNLGLGSLRMMSDTDVFFLVTEYQTSTFELAYIVTPATMVDSGQPGEVFLTVGVSGSDDQNRPLPDIGAIGLDMPVPIPFFAEPCDTNADGRCGVSDIDTLLAHLGTAASDLDLDPADPLITLADLDAWLAVAGSENIGGAYVMGDANLDGTVDAHDLNFLGLHWRQEGTIGWGGGDFNGDNKVDGQDLNVLALNWRRSTQTVQATAVPEPAGMVLLLVALLVWVARTCSGRGVVFSEIDERKYAAPVRDAL